MPAKISLNNMNELRALILDIKEYLEKDNNKYYCIISLFFGLLFCKYLCQI